MLCQQELWQNFHGDGKAHGQHQGHKKRTRIWCWQNVSLVGFCVYQLTDRLNPFGKSSTSSLLGPLPGIRVTISKFWCHENETGSLNFGPLRKRSLSFSFCTILRSPVTTWLHGTYRNSEPGQVQGRGFWERLLKSICCRLLLLLKILEATERV